MDKLLCHDPKFSGLKYLQINTQFGDRFWGFKKLPGLTARDVRIKWVNYLVIYFARIVAFLSTNSAPVKIPSPLLSLQIGIQCFEFSLQAVIYNLLQSSTYMNRLF